MDSDPPLSTNMIPERTFQFDEGLPPLPVPQLDDTLDKYLDSVRAVTTDEEYRETQRVVEEFRSSLGPQLHSKLLERARDRKNWLEEWWTERVYLTSRTPLGVCSMYGANRSMQTFWPPCLGVEVERAAISTWHMLKYFEILRKEKIPVQKSKTGKMVFSMDQLRHVFNGSRVPGINSDKLINVFKTEYEGPCPTHLVVSSNGHLFKVETFDRMGKLISAQELARHLQYVKDHSKQRGQGVAALTGDTRDSYARNREYLLSLDPVNAEHVTAIDESIAMLAFDEDSPSTYSELFQTAMSGHNAHNHWLDKSYLMIVNKNGTLSCICDHAPFDAMVCVEMSHWGYRRMVKDGGTWPDPSSEMRDDLPDPEELIFTTDAVVNEAIDTAQKIHHKLVDDVEILTSFYASFGKKWCKQFRLHPDIVCQLAIQLAYYRMYGRSVATYETATTRQFYHGRTETCRSCTPESLAWCKSMVDPAATKSTQADLLKAAFIKHATLMGECLQNQGCDRHLLGLYFISDELGLSVPEIFLDAGFIKSGGGGNFTLSTSLAGYTPFLGLVAPMCHDGYFCTYRITDDNFEFCVVSHHSSSETDNHALFKLISQAMNDIHGLTLHAMSKL
ncbi:peroxisomal carnitine O-octanoyltransferase-like isoform X1 [Diadema antillarum]|uniref:peroxisomal carnitine O-octanoyltransferase-like isoform X1 n=1 Tax=Diadema antillarum TaxID=105358 RepID=UPI003A85F5B0